MDKKSSLPKSLLQHTPWEQNTTPIWPASIFILKRNLVRHFFPSKMNENQMETCQEIIKEAILQSNCLVNPTFVKAESLSPTEKEYIFEHFFITEGLQNARGGQGFIIDEQASCLVQLNIGDHLTLNCIDCNVDWKNNWNRLTQLESSLSSALEFSYHPKFGYLTSDPFSCGTAFHIQAYLHLPALIHLGKLQATLETSKEPDIQIQGISGDSEELIGDLVIFQNRYSLGITEESILHHLHTSATKMMKAEQTCRDEIKEKNSPDIMDKISRAYGLLAHSYQLQTKEALSALSFLKLGIDLKWVKGISNSQINDLLFKCRRAHLVFSEENLAKDAISHKRSEFLHDSLKNVQLNLP